MEVLKENLQNLRSPLSTYYYCYYNIHLMNKSSSYINILEHILSVIGLSDNFLMLKGRLFKIQNLNSNLLFDKYLYLSR